MQILLVSLAIFITSIVGSFYPFIMPLVAIGSLLIILFFAYRMRKKEFRPKGKKYKLLHKIKKKREKVEKDKHKHISDQINYIEKVWGYTKEQENIIKKFVETKAYLELYNKLTASILPQIITLIDNCNEREQKGCKRDVSQRLKSLSLLMKQEMQKSQHEKKENFDISLEVCDQLLSEKRY
ncbi:MAG: hypothetical protein QM493_06365 [Sulfurovum sp.]